MPKARLTSGASSQLFRLLACVLALLLVGSVQAQDNYASYIMRTAQAADDGDKSATEAESGGLHALANPDLRISIRATNMSAREALERISAEGGLRLAYQESVFEDEPVVDLDLEGVTVLDALYQVTRQANLLLQVTPTGHLIVTRMSAREAGEAPVRRPAPISEPEPVRVQTGSIIGRVTDAGTGDPIPGANVAVLGTTHGAATGLDGTYRIAGLDPGTYTLRASFIGFISQEVADVPVEADEETELNFVLREDVAGLEEVLVVGYGTQTRQDVTGSISSVDADAFEVEPLADVSAALQGRAAGVEVVRNGGAPGAGASIRIRGTGTVNDAGPLVVVDGVPTSEGTMSDIDPDNIESIQVLKDASAAAIYGNRAANGVVLIQTKRGRFGQGLEVSFTGSAGVTSPIRTIEVLEAPMLAQLKRERYENDGIPVNPIWMVDSLQTQRTNWQNELLGNGAIQDYNLSVRGGGEHSTFFVAGTYADENGMMESSYFRRYDLTVNSDHRIGSRLQLHQNLRLARTKSSSLNTLSAQNGVLWSAIRFHPGMPVQWSDGTYSSSQIHGEFGDINNPIYTVDTQDAHTKGSRVLGNVEAELDLVKGLALKANVGLDYESGDFYEFAPIIDKQIRARSRNELTRRFSEAYSVLSELSLTYDASIGAHEFDAFGAYSVQTFDSEYFQAVRMDYEDESETQRVLDSGNSIVGAEGTRTDDALQSYISRVNYALRNRYLLTASFRVDGSSRFAEDNRWGYFPAVSAGWRISEEPFFEAFPSVVSNLKLTAGWGRSGNQSIARLQYLGLFGRGARYSFGGQQVTGVNLVRIPNPAISWETAEMTNIGLETAFFDYALRAKIEYFVKNTKDVLLAPPTVGMVGTATVPDVNVGRIDNHGLEIDLDYSHRFGQLDFNAFANAAFVRNEVVSINEEFLASRTYGRPNQEISRTFEGHPIATFYGWRTDGLYQTQEEINSDPNIANDPRQDAIEPGDVRFVDLNGDQLIDGQDREIIGDPHPAVTYGFGAQLGYGNLDVRLFFVGAGGVDIYNADRMQGLDPTYPFNMYAEVEDRWNGPGTSNSIPRMTTRRTNLNHRTSDLFVERGDYVRLKSFTIGYTLPRNIAARGGLGQARIYVTGQNVFTLTSYSGIDPELGYSDGNLQRNVDFAQYPQPRMWTLGLAVDI